MSVPGKSDGELVGDVVVYGDNIAIEKAELEHEQLAGGVILMTNVARGFNLVKGKIISIGERAEEHTGLKIGDTVLCDHYGAYADTHPIAIYPSENVIVKVLE
jgi:co-chaperonin GroES (HSP10)